MMHRRSPSWSPPPRGGYRRHQSPRRLYGRDDLQTSLLVRNLSRDCRPEDLSVRFEEFGPLKDVYLPKDYYTREPRGFGFVQFLDPQDAADAQYEMDGKLVNGRKISVVFAEENRKKPTEMRSRENTRESGQHGDRRPPYQGRSHFHSPKHYSSARRSYSRSYSPSNRRGYDHRYSASLGQDRD
ncbi:hypothetical protein O6H91_06G129700 [Diphasiastrum complanatum]|uniref:Uncharacterized protein n=2 Tax=Diphasiastrum complanatum TaxID=34168 RepID=A0ACC2DJ44_DIPCM|nr:hypothetical protein O6H91_06G129700 [Diphasiastrum complanatum]